MQYGYKNIYEKTTNFLPKSDVLMISKNKIADICLFGGFFAIFSALMGFAAIKWRKFYFTCPFVYISFTIGFVLTLAGSISLSYG